MRKFFSKIILFVLAIAIIPKVVFAAADVCGGDTNTYTITKDGNTRVFDLNGGSYTMQFYRTSLNGANIKTYCLDPGRVGLSRTNQYTCERLIDPTGQTSGVGSKQHALDASITRAYYLIYGTDNTDTVFNKALGEIVFRWLHFNYNLGVTEVNMSNGTQYVNYFKLEYGGRVNKFWDGLSGENGQIVEKAKEIFYDAVRVGNRVYAGEGVGGSATYEQLVADGDLPNEKFEYTVTTSDDASMGGRKIYTVQFTGTPAGATVWWSDFHVGIEGGNAKIERIENDGNGTIQIYVNEGYNSGEYELYIDTKYYLESSAMTSLKILHGTKTSATVQRMLVAVDTGDSGAAHEVIKGGHRIPLKKGLCEYPGGDKTKVGIWCDYDENGNKIPSSCHSDAEHCPPIETPGKSCSSENGTYYGISGNVVTALVFYEECCENPGSGMTEEDKDLYCPCGKPDISFIGNCSEFNTANEVTNYVKDVRGNADLKTCLFNHASTDAAGNTVRMTDQTTVVNNPYCKVGCIEEYEFTLPNAQYTTSGGYFSLSSSITGKRTCYVNASDAGKFNGIDHEKFVNDLFEASKKVAEAQTAYNLRKAALANFPKSSDTCGACGGGPVWKTGSFEYNSCEASRNGDQIDVKCEKKEYGGYSDGKCAGKHQDQTCKSDGSSGSSSGLRKKIMGTTGSGENAVAKSLDSYLAAVTAAEARVQAIIKQYDDCTHGWENNFVFNPVTEFEYDEPYQDMSGFNNKFEKTGETSGASTNYCSGDVGDTYSCGGSDSSYNQTYVTCSGGSCSQTSKSVSQSIYMKREKTTTATYQPKNKFGVYTPIGTIKLNEDTGLYTVLCKEENCLPVSLNATTGVFNYKFKFSNIGQYNDSNTNGRLMGGSNNVFDAVNIEAGYVCQYVNNCPDCDYTCVGDKCEIDPDPKCPDCPYVCQNCVFDGSDMTYYYRTVSINNLFPNNRSYGPNWSNSKGKYTKELVENEGDEAYKEPEYSYTITANQMKKIREFNSQVGGYLNTQMPNGENALSCFDKSGYSNIYCTSTFLDTAPKKNDVGPYFKTNARNDQWQLWQDSGFFTSSTKYSLRDGEGPSWK